VGSITAVVDGVVLLANTLGYVGWSVWFSVFSLWPLLVIAWGLELLGRGTGLRWLGILGAVVVLAGLLYGVLVLGPQRAPFSWFPFGGSAGTTAFSTSRAHDAAVTQGDASVKVGATQLEVGAGQDLASIEGRAPEGAAPVLTSTSSSGSADVSVTEPNRSGVVDATGQTLDVSLDRAVSWRSIGLEVGAVDGRIDLRGLDVRSVSVDTGASQLLLTVGARSPAVSVVLQGGAAAVTVRVPASAAVTLDAKSGLSDVTVPPSFTRVAGTPLVGESRWRGEGAGGPRVDISVQSGVSSITLQTY